MVQTRSKPVYFVFPALGPNEPRTVDEIDHCIVRALLDPDRQWPLPPRQRSSLPFVLVFATRLRPRDRAFAIRSHRLSKKRCLASSLETSVFHLIDQHAARRSNPPFQSPPLRTNPFPNGYMVAGIRCGVKDGSVRFGRNPVNFRSNLHRGPFHAERVQSCIRIHLTRRAR